MAPGVVPSDLASLLRACLPHLKASLFLKNCVFDMCKFQRLQSVLCAHMAALTEICQDAGYAVKPWRGPQFCRELCRAAGPVPSQADASRGRASECSHRLGGPLVEPLCFHACTGKAAVRNLHREKSQSLANSEPSQPLEAMRSNARPCRRMPRSSSAHRTHRLPA